MAPKSGATNEQVTEQGIRWQKAEHKQEQLLQMATWCLHSQAGRVKAAHQFKLGGKAEQTAPGREAEGSGLFRFDVVKRLKQGQGVSVEQSKSPHDTLGLMEYKRSRSLHPTCREVFGRCQQW